MTIDHQVVHRWDVYDGELPDFATIEVAQLFFVISLVHSLIFLMIVTVH